MSESIICEFNISLIQAFVEILFDEKSSENIKTLRLNGLKELNKYLEYYQSEGYLECLINKIAEKKIKMIKQTTSKAEMNKIIKPSCPHFNGSKFIPDKYNVIEEELICWSESSLQAPLGEIGFKRYEELFNIVFSEYKDIF